jgi:hypothetical protein
MDQTYTLHLEVQLWRVDGPKRVDWEHASERKKINDSRDPSIRWSIGGRYQEASYL